MGSSQFVGYPSEMRRFIVVSFHYWPGRKILCCPSGTDIAAGRRTRSGGAHGREAHTVGRPLSIVDPVQFRKYRSIVDTWLGIGIELA